jgi:cell division protein FtsQ
VRKRARRSLREWLALLSFSPRTAVERIAGFDWRLAVMVVLMLTISTATWFGMRGVDRMLSQPVNHVTIDGELQHADRKRLASVIGESITRGFWRSDLLALKQKLEAEPWIRHAHIRRQWPDNLTVTLSEQVPVAYWQERALLNDQGEVFVPGKLPRLALPHLSGPDTSEQQVLRDYRWLEQQFAQMKMQPVLFAVDAKGSWRVVLESGIEIALGDGDMTPKLQRLERIFAAQLGSRSEQIARIDMRYTNGLAVRWRDNAGHALADRGD